MIKLGIINGLNSILSFEENNFNFIEASAKNFHDKYLSIVCETSNPRI